MVCCQMARKLIGKASDSEPFSSLAFKVITDPFVGKLTFFRVYSRRIGIRLICFKLNKGQKRELAEFLQMQANKRDEISEIRAETLPLQLVLNLQLQVILCDEKNRIILESMEFPEPVINVAIEPKTKAGQEKNGYCFV